MQKISEKKPYEKPVLEVCGSMVESTLCDTTDGSIPSMNFDYKPNKKPGHDNGHHHGWGR
jgi:hypothetical protein